MIAAALILLGCLGLMYLQHTGYRSDLRIVTAERDDARADVEWWRDQYREVYALWEKAQEDELDALGERNRLADDKARLVTDLEWSRIVIAAQGLEIDRHFLMPTVDGMRKRVAERPAPVADVVPLRREGGA